jgi:FlaA1/EpsC-like NDP-sugar epimerase
VRFGNVLGSNGSVIPIFKKQIASGRAGDRDASGHAALLHDHSRSLPTRAASRGHWAEGGQICVLDMGEPVKIVDLARNLILLVGPEAR